MPATNKPKAAASSKDDDDMKQVAELIGKLIFLQTHRIMEILILILEILILIFLCEFEYAERSMPPTPQKKFVG